LISHQTYYIYGSLTITILIILLFAIALTGCKKEPGLWIDTPISDYEVDVTPVDLNKGQFKVETSLIFDPNLLNKNFNPEKWGVPQNYIMLTKYEFDKQVAVLPDLILSSKRGNGLLLRVVEIPGPLYQQATIVSSTGVSVTIPLCYSTCPTIKVILLDFQKDSFFQAKYVKETVIEEFGDKDKITWDVDSDDSIQFSYIPKPYFLFLPFIKPLIGITSWSKFIIGLIGTLAGSVLTLISGVCLDVIKGNLKERFKGKFADTSGEQTEIIDW
jgi:hypothetical protein